MRRLQFWLGNQAPINVPGIVACLVGVRHSHLSTSTGTRTICDTAHHSWNDWMYCSQNMMRKDYLDFLNWSTLSGLDQSRALARFEATAVQALERARRLRMF